RGCASVWDQFTVGVAGGGRDALLAHLSERRIGAAVYYPIPLHQQACFAPWAQRAGSLPASEQAAREVLSLPIYECLTRAEQDAVIEALAAFCGAGATKREQAA
ncbi:MAG TPA: DegT/DnrJ/EryC1/StrS family aminotransferase, partial [Lacipirellulaceae bacterium]|nr:DegT/DnrJ/EryC1/StrS family aminotransferase [Lacipirellulaceae bacterium]